MRMDTLNDANVVGTEAVELHIHEPCQGLILAAVEIDWQDKTACL
jgi:hypothetical protein